MTTEPEELDDVELEEEEDPETDAEKAERLSKSQGRSLRRARAEELRSLRDELAHLKAEKLEKDKPVDVDAISKKIRAEVAAEYEEKANAVVLATEAADALRQAGYKGNPKRGVRALDLSDVTIAKGVIDADALADAVEDLKLDSPGLFVKSRAASAADDDDEADSDGATRSRGRTVRPRETGGPRRTTSAPEDPIVAMFRSLSG